MEPRRVGHVADFILQDPLPSHHTSGVAIGKRSEKFAISSGCSLRHSQSKRKSRQAERTQTRVTVPKAPKKRRYDLREYWPWYERKWPTRGGYATPPPFPLSAIGDQPAMPTWQRRALQAICVAAAIVFVIYIVWGIFFAK